MSKKLEQSCPYDLLFNKCGYPRVLLKLQTELNKEQDDLFRTLMASGGEKLKAVFVDSSSLMSLLGDLQRYPEKLDQVCQMIFLTDTLRAIVLSSRLSFLNIRGLFPDGESYRPFKGAGTREEASKGVSFFRACLVEQFGYPLRLQAWQEVAVTLIKTRLLIVRGHVIKWAKIDDDTDRVARSASEILLSICPNLFRHVLLFVKPTKFSKKEIKAKFFSRQDAIENGEEVSESAARACQF